IDGIHVRVVRADVVVAVVLNRIEAGDAGIDEAEVIGRADGLDRVLPYADAFERLDPRIEDRPDLGVVLQLPAEELAGAVVDVEVDVELRARRRVRVPREMLRDPRFRSEQALLLAAPQRDADRAPRPRADRLQNAHRLDDRGRAVGVVGRADSGVPG